VRDAEWIAELLRHGLVRPSFIPGREQRELRELVRYRRSVVEERAREANRLQKVLEGANIKLASVASDVLGRSGRDMLKAICEGTEDPAALAALARGSLKAKSEQLKEALRGLVGSHQRFILAEQLTHIAELEARLERLNAEIEARLAPFASSIVLLETIPGVGHRVADALLAEIGVEMDRFPTDRHIASWAKVCPGNRRSAGKAKREHVGGGNPWLRTLLVEAAWGASHTKDTFLAAQYRRLRGRLGERRAALAVAHSILVIAYHILRTGKPYQELGANFYDQNSPKAVIRRLTHRLESLGFHVQLQPKEDLQSAQAAA
jgi:transposase